MTPRETLSETRFFYAGHSSPPSSQFFRFLSKKMIVALFSFHNVLSNAVRFFIIPVIKYSPFYSLFPSLLFRLSQFPCSTSKATQYNFIVFPFFVSFSLRSCTILSFLLPAQKIVPVNLFLVFPLPS